MNQDGRPTQKSQMKYYDSDWGYGKSDKYSRYDKDGYTR